MLAGVAGESPREGRLARFQVPLGFRELTFIDSRSGACVHHSCAPQGAERAGLTRVWPQGEESYCGAQPKTQRGKVISPLLFHLLSITERTGSICAELSVLSFGDNHLCTLFCPKKEKKRGKKAPFQLPGQCLGCAWLFQFMLFSSLNPVLYGNVGAQELGLTWSLPLSVRVIDGCVTGSADAVVTQSTRELVSAVEEDAVGLGLALDEAPLKAFPSHCTTT